MTKENISQEFRLKNIDETRTYFIEKLKQNELISKTHKKVCKTLNYIEHLFILASLVTGFIAMTALIRKYKSIFKKEKKKHDNSIVSNN